MCSCNSFPISSCFYICISGSSFLRIQVFLSPCFQGTCFPGSRSKFCVQGLGPGFKISLFEGSCIFFVTELWLPYYKFWCQNKFDIAHPAYRFLWMNLCFRGFAFLLSFKQKILTWAMLIKVFVEYFDRCLCLLETNIS